MNFRDLTDRIIEHSPFQKKKLTNYLSTRDETFFRDADEFTEKYTAFLNSRGISIDYAVQSYLGMCSTMLRYQVEFMRSGAYPVVSAEHARENVYESEDQMLSYMVGLGMSQFLWSTHYDIFKFFSRVIDAKSDNISSYLEVGPGHGLFLETALRHLNQLEEAVAIDISATALELTRDIVGYFLPGQEKVRYELGDITETPLGRKFDFITVGEVIEHVERPAELLGSLRDLLSTDGTMFVSTCANCPALDHVYQFNTMREIRDLITGTGLVIHEELALPVEDMSVEKAEADRVTINYCALLGAPDE